MHHSEPSLPRNRAARRNSPAGRPASLDTLFDYAKIEVCSPLDDLIAAEERALRIRIEALRYLKQKRAQISALTIAAVA